MKHLLLTSAFITALAGAATAAPESYVLDSSHSQVVFSYNHLGFSTTYNMFSGFEGEITFDKDAPAESSVSVSIPVASLITGWDDRYKHFMSPDFFGQTPDDAASFVSTSIEVTGETTAMITGDFTLNGVTKSVVLDAKLNGMTDEHPMAKKPWAGFDATTKLVRSDFGLGNFAPFVSDEVEVMISVEAMKAE